MKPSVLKKLMQIVVTPLAFFRTIFPLITQRSKDEIAEFDRFNIADFPDMALLGVEVLNRVEGMALGQGERVRHSGARKPV